MREKRCKRREARGEKRGESCVPYNNLDSLPFMNSVVAGKGASIKSKHTMIRLSIINEAYVDGDIDLKHKSTQHIPSDMLSKLVPVTTHQHFKKNKKKYYRNTVLLISYHYHY